MKKKTKLASTPPPVRHPYHAIRLQISNAYRARVNAVHQVSLVGILRRGHAFARHQNTCRAVRILLLLQRL